MSHPPQKGLRRFFGSRLFLLVGFVVAILFAIGFARAYYQDYRVRQEIESLQEELKNGKTKNFELLKLYEWVKSPEFVEEKARTELNMKKPGEQVMVITNLENSEKNGESNQKEDMHLNNPIKWWYYFTHQKLIIN